MASSVPYVSVEDLSEWIGEPIQEEWDVKRAQSVIRYAQTLCTDYTGKTWEPGQTPEKVEQVIIQVASRGYLNPESWAYESIDDWRAGNRPIAELGMYLTDTEKGMLDEYRVKKTAGLGIMSAGREPAVLAPDYVFTPGRGGGGFTGF